MSAVAIERTDVRRSLLLDAAVSGAFGVLVAAGSPWLDGVLGGPVAFLVPLGVFLVLYAGALWLIARVGAPAPLVRAVIAGNAAWTALSVAAVAFDWLTLTTTGTVLTLAQAAAVALLAELQLAGLRRA
jgi:hypothetical protein